MSELSKLRGHYDTYEISNLAESFYIPLFKNSRAVNRVSCYFSAKALALYASGLQEFISKPGSKYRLIVSEHISKEDYDAIKCGELSYEKYDSSLVGKLRENLTLDETDSLGTLVSLMEAGVVEFRIAFVVNGLFHSKWAYVIGDDSEKMVMIGSNNETPAAIDINYEEFDFRDYYENDNFEEKFEKMWNNKRDGFIVVKPSDTLWSEMKKYSRNIQVNPALLKDCLVLDLDRDNIVLINKLKKSPSNYEMVQHSKITTYVKSRDPDIVFRDGLTYIDFNTIIDKMSAFCKSKGIMLYVTDRLQDYINSHDLLIQKRITLGLDIKSRRENIHPQFEEYKRIVDSMMSRKLFDKQMWDSFFMYAMKKAGNFSVPGSGKTASVLGVYAFLKNQENFRRIIVVCPLNAFDSWINEFKACFGYKATVFDARDYSGENARSTFIRCYGSSELILINYDSLSKYSEALGKNAVEGGLLVFDEGHYIKNTDARRTKGAITASHDSVRTLILTGTPMPNSYEDLYSLLNILFPEEYKAVFRYDRYTLRNPSDYVVNDMNRKLQPFYIRTSKDELGIPPANEDLSFHIPPTGEEQRLYDEICNATIDNPLSRIIRVLQAESNPRMLMSKDVPEDIIQDFHEEPMGESSTLESEMKRETLVPELSGLEPLIDKIPVTSKTKRCIDLVSDLVSSGKPVIIWCIFRGSITNLDNLLKDRGTNCKVIDGSVPIKNRTDIIEGFKKREFDVLITNPHTLAESVSLHTVCHDTVYFEYSYNLVHLLQSKDRIHRLGLPRGQYTQHRFLMADYAQDGQPVSLDEQIYARLCYKEDLMLDAIESGRLEAGTASSEEDIREIFSKMGWKYNGNKSR